MHQSGSMAEAAVLNELSRCSSEVVDEILLLCFILENSCSQLCILPKAMAWMRCDCEVRDTSLCQERAYKSPVDKHDQIMDCNSVCSIWKFTPVNLVDFDSVDLHQLKMELQIKKSIFLAILQSVLKFIYQSRKHGCVFSSIHRTVFSQYIKIHTLPSFELAPHCILCPGFSPGGVNSAPIFSWCWVMVVLGQLP